MVMPSRQRPALSLGEVIGMVMQSEASHGWLGRAGRSRAWPGIAELVLAERGPALHGKAGKKCERRGVFKAPRCFAFTWISRPTSSAATSASTSHRAPLRRFEYKSLDDLVTARV